MTWLPLDPGFQHPQHAGLASGHHLRPLRADDVELDYPAVMGSQESLWDRYGVAWRWPPADMTFEQDLADLQRHERENAAHETFAYAVFDAAESELVGCLYIDPPEADSPPGTQAIVSWWVVDREADGALEQALDDFVPVWLEDSWGLSQVHYHP